ncbi:MAG TPA: hypothetical protein VG326_06385 [Tepidisphaeraceae bacterium]|jgi:hypothetical protein|nr:hypothetical protein [Tepidisphaeraceae bacterium]
MPSVIDYQVVLTRMQALGLEPQYYNSGAFGFEVGVTTHFIGWIGPPDATIRPAALERTRPIPAPYEPNLTRLAMQAWRRFFPGPIWIMPKSQWAYELDFGSKAWLPAALQKAGLDPASLQGRTDSPAIEFTTEEADRVAVLVRSLLENLLGSDFALAFPGDAIACTLHHHKQIWWLGRDEELIAKLDAIVT